MVSIRVASFVASLSLLAVGVAPSTLAQALRPHVSGGVHRVLQQEGTTNLIITMREGTAPALALAEMESRGALDRGAKTTTLVANLQRHAQTSQEALLAMLAVESEIASAPLYESVKSFWISNQVYVRGATAQLVELLATRSDVLKIDDSSPTPRSSSPDASHSLNTTALEEPKTTAKRQDSANEWNIDLVQAPEAWAQGINGSGVVIGAIGHGIRHTHVTLKDSFRGAYGWYDPYEHTESPTLGDLSVSYVTTYAMGVAVGTHGYGVAPGASWMNCRGSRNSFDYDFAKMVDKAPAVVQVVMPFFDKAPYQEPFAVMQAAGIIMVGRDSRADNEPVCGSVEGSGAWPNVIGVGGTTREDSLVYFSSRGPTATGEIWPHISAPTYFVKSASNTADNHYFTTAGNAEVAAVEGVILLILQAKPDATFDEIKEILFTSADRESLVATGDSCGGIPEDTFPNNSYGHGRLNANRAVARALSLRCKAHKTAKECSKDSYCTFVKTFQVCVHKK